MTTRERVVGIATKAAIPALVLCVIMYFAFSRRPSYSFELTTGDPIVSIVQVRRLPLPDPLDLDARERLIDGKPSRYDEGGNRHHYVEYILPDCRLQVHSAPESSDWVEILPKDLDIDDLLTPRYAAQLDSDRVAYTICVKCPADRVYLNIQVRERRVSRISWLRLPRHLIED